MTVYPDDRAIQALKRYDQAETYVSETIVNTVYIDDGREYYFSGEKVSEEFVIDGDVPTISLKPADDKNAEIFINGKLVEQDQDGGFIIDVTPGEDIHINSKEKGFH